MDSVRYEVDIDGVPDLERQAKECTLFLRCFHDACKGKPERMLQSDMHELQRENKVLDECK